MNALTALLVADHLRDLQAEADAARHVRMARGIPEASSPARRLLGRSARRLSLTLANLAVRLDPADERRSRPLAV